MPLYKTLLASSALVLVFSPLTCAALDLSPLTETEVALEEQPAKAGKAFMAATIINAPMQKVCATIQDFAHYPEFVPNTAKTHVTPQADKTSLLEVTLNLPLGKIKKYRLKMTPQVTAQQCRLAWAQVPWEGLKQEETIADTTGHWLLSPLAGNEGKTVVRYYVSTDPGPVPLGLGWIVDSMSKDSIPKMLEALRNRVR